MKFLETHIFDQKWSRKNPKGKPVLERYFYYFKQTLNKNTAILIFTKCLGKRANQSLNGLLKFQNLFFSTHVPEKQPSKNSTHNLPRKTCCTASSVRIPYWCTDSVRLYGQEKNFTIFSSSEIWRNHLEKRAEKICHQNCKFCRGKHPLCLAEIAEIKEWFFLGFFCASETCRILLLSPSLSLEMKSLQTLALFFFLLFLSQKSLLWKWTKVFVCLSPSLFCSW